ncbi:hypothetical protein [Methylobacterium aerolatum]|uniref:Uncharacterized protein n=1 Tax=Methylobacterium aerolatum TaxID=418708 RepID=A0ABU0HY65_9HYPH|nr:hypothetical protein [Methylobacterium aerolatum]MDQ0447287.1 hypothetical protein [Methylobacterium aerolatum]
MHDLIVNLVSGLIGALVGVMGSLFVYSHGYLRIEAIERRKQKISLLDDLMAVRYVLQNKIITSDEARDFNRAMARVPHVFAEHKPVIAAYDALSVGISDDNLMRFFESVIIACGLQKYSVSKSHLTRVMTVGASSTT